MGQKGCHWVITSQDWSAMTLEPGESDALLTPSEVAAMFRVDPKTVTRWAKAGKLSSVRTLGGHRRYLASEVKALLDGADASAAAAPVPTNHPVVSTDGSGLTPLPPPPPNPGASGGLPTSR